MAQEWFVQYKIVFIKIFQVNTIGLWSIFVGFWKMFMGKNILYLFYLKLNNMAFILLKNILTRFSWAICHFEAKKRLLRMCEGKMINLSYTLKISRIWLYEKKIRFLLQVWFHLNQNSLNCIINSASFNCQGSVNWIQTSVFQQKILLNFSRFLTSS